MFFFGKPKVNIEEFKIKRLVSSAERFIQEKYQDPQHKEKATIIDTARVQFSERDNDAVFSERNNGARYSIDEYETEEDFARSMRRFIAGDSAVTSESLFQKKVKDSFSGTLIRYINQKGMRDSAVYKAAGVDRRLFSKIVSNYDYKPSKDTCLALALALHLNLDEVNDLISRAGYTLSHSIKRDVIIEFCIREKEYSLMYVNELLYRLGNKGLVNT